MSYFKIKSHAKINLALNIVGKTNTLHKIESIVSFLSLHDKILIRKIKNKNHKINFTGNFSSNIKTKNTISYLLENLERKKLLHEKFEIVIQKNIPTQSGLGGGSSNAARILNFLIKEKFIKVSKKEILNISNSIGSDVILGVYSKNLIVSSNNLIKTFPSKKVFVLIVKPKFGCSTKFIYSMVRKYNKPKFIRPSKNMFKLKFLKNLNNELETIALKKYPRLNSLKKFLEKLSKVEFVRMTGSGSAIIAYFRSDKKCKEAEKKVKNKFKNYWCKTSKTI